MCVGLWWWGSEVCVCAWSAVSLEQLVPELRQKLVQSFCNTKEKRQSVRCTYTALVAFPSRRTATCCCIGMKNAPPAQGTEALRLKAFWRTEKDLPPPRIWRQPCERWKIKLFMHVVPREGKGLGHPSEKFHLTSSSRVTKPSSSANCRALALDVCFTIKLCFVFGSNCT